MNQKTTDQNQAAIEACQRDCDEYRKENPDCHGYDYGNAWRAGREYECKNPSPAVQGLVDAIKNAVRYYEDSIICEKHCDESVGFHEPECSIQKGFEIALAAYEESLK